MIIRDNCSRGRVAITFLSVSRVNLPQRRDFFSSLHIHILLRFKEEPPEVENTDSPASIFSTGPDILASLFEVEIYHSTHISCLCQSLRLSFRDLSKATHLVVPYICILPYIILPYLRLCLVHFLLPLRSTERISSILCRHTPSLRPLLLLLPVNCIVGDGDTFQWQINRLLPSRLPSGLMPHRISNQICHQHSAGVVNTVRFWEGRGLQISTYN